MLNVEREGSRITEKAYRLAENYLLLEKGNKAKFDKVNEVLLDENAREKRFTSQELAQKLDADGQSAYRSARAAISYVRSYAKAKMKTNIREYYRKQAARTDDPIKLAGFKMEREKDLRDVDKYYNIEGYIPQARFGRFAVKLKDEAGHILAFTTFETKREAKLYQDAYPVGSVFSSTTRVKVPGVIQKVLPQVVAKSEYIDLKKVLKKKNPQMFIEALHSYPLVSRVLKAQGASDPDLAALLDTLDKELLKFFGKGRLAPRKNIAGWSQDVKKNLESFFTSFPYSMAKKYGRHVYEDMLKALPEDQQNYGRNLIDFYEGRRQWEGRGNQRIRRVVYDFYLGLKPSFFIVNESQRLSTTFPALIAEFGGRAKGMGQATRAMVVAQKKEIGIFKEWLARGGTMREAIDRYPNLEKWERDTLKTMADTGEIGAARQKEFIGAKRDWLSKAEKFGVWSEKSNRIHAALASLEVAKANGLYEPQQIYDFASKFVGDTQFVYSKATRPGLMRGPWAPIFMFKSYLLNYANLQKQLWGEKNKTAAVTSTAILLALSGAYGIPGGKLLLKKALPWAMQKVGLIDKEKDLDREVFEWEKEFSKSPLREILLRGFPSLFKVDGDLAFGSAEFLGLAPMTIIENVSKFVRGFESAKGASWGERLMRLAPTELKHVGRLVELWFGRGLPTDEYGRPRLTEEDLSGFPKEMRAWAKENWAELPKKEDVGAWEQVMYLLGFPTSTFRKYSEEVWAIKSEAREGRLEKSGYNREIGKLMADNLNDERLVKMILAKGRDDKWTFGPSRLKSNFNYFLGKLPPDVATKIRQIRAESEKAKLAISFDAILSQMREFLEKR